MDSNSGNRNSLITLVLFFVLIAVSFCFSFYIYHTQPRIAYVRSQQLLYEYNGMRDARETYKSQTDAWQANIDTLRMQYQRCLADYQNSYKALSEKEKQEKQGLVKKLEDNLKNYTAVVRQQAEEKEKTMTDAVLNQINSYVEEYAKKKGYDLVIGGANGSLLYGNKAYDITDELLQALNKEYRIMPSQPPAGAKPTVPAP